MRTYYESKDDLAAEQTAKQCMEDGIAEVLEQRLLGDIQRIELVKVPVSYRADFAAIDHKGDIRGWVEFKSRSFKFGQYDTVMISLSKLIHMRRLGETVGVPILVIQDCKGELRYCLLDNLVHGIDVRYQIGGRTVQQRDSADKEPVAYIELAAFKHLGYCPT